MAEESEVMPPPAARPDWAALIAETIVLEKSFLDDPEARLRLQAAIAEALREAHSEGLDEVPVTDMEENYGNETHVYRYSARVRANGIWDNERLRREGRRTWLGQKRVAQDGVRVLPTDGPGADVPGEGGEESET